MKFLIDNQLPRLWLAISRKGHEATHVLDISMAQADDSQVWAHASTNSMIVVSKDEDFLHLCRLAF